MGTVSLLGEASGWINYDLPAHLVGIGLKGKYRGQTQRWFAFLFEGEESEIRINPPPGGHAPEFDAWERSEEHTSELQSLMRTSYAVFCLKTKTSNESTKNTQTK